MVAIAKKAWFALMNWKTRMGSPRSPVRTRPLPLPGYRAPGAVVGSHAADGSPPRARRWSGRPVGGLHRDQPDEPSSRSPGRSVRTRATAPPVFAQIGPEQPSVAGIPAHRVGDSSASMTPPSQMQRYPPNRVNPSRKLSSRPEDSHLRALPDPYVNLSIHTAPDVRPFPWQSRQWAKSVGFTRRSRSNQSRAPLVLRRNRLNLRRAQRMT